MKLKLPLPIPNKSVVLTHPWFSLIPTFVSHWSLQPSLWKRLRSNVYSTALTIAKHIICFLSKKFNPSFSHLKSHTAHQFCNFSISSFSAVDYRQSCINQTQSKNSLLQGSKLRLSGHQSDQKLSVGNQVLRTGVFFCQPFNLKGKRHSLCI